MRVGGGGGGGGCVSVAVRVRVSEGGINSVLVAVAEETGGGSVVPTGGGGRRVAVAFAGMLGLISTVGVGWREIKTAAVQ